NGCIHTPVADGTSCSDGDACNGKETCEQGRCAAGTPLVCNDGNACTTDSCDPASGCKETPVPDGASCSDGRFCHGAETCHAGACTPGPAPSCDDGNACTADRCDLQLDRCVSAAVPDGTSCSDGNVCNGAEVCRVGTCTPGTPLSCEDNNPCTADSCGPNGCIHTPVADGTTCSDGNGCNGDETCRAGACSPGTPLVCNDNNACTTD